MTPLLWLEKKGSPTSGGVCGLPRILAEHLLRIVKCCVIISIHCESLSLGHHGDKWKRSWLKAILQLRKACGSVWMSEWQTTQWAARERPTLTWTPRHGRGLIYVQNRKNEEMLGFISTHNTTGSQTPPSYISPERSHNLVKETGGLLRFWLVLWAVKQFKLLQLRKGWTLVSYYCLI